MYLLVHPAVDLHKHIDHRISLKMFTIFAFSMYVHIHGYEHLQEDPPFVDPNSKLVRIETRQSLPVLDPKKYVES